eukprot:TRINITY_DN8692_c0_g1_i1.p1 TRINITY_DN8692_c0_g1~~TRINITY_DN8692_c0_g1_i1.p1  ORF type:complete len:450 (+),score=56.34 TRINITY_DN8692_c0_g1_i1:155-1504(+)
MSLLAIVTTTAVSVSKILLVCFGGFVLSKNGLLTHDVNKQVSKMIFTFFTPCLLFSNVSKVVKVDSLYIVLIILVIALLTHLLAYLITLVVRFALRIPLQFQKVFTAACVFGNCGNLPLPLIVAITGDSTGPFGQVENASEEAIAYTSLYMSICAILVWTVSMPYLSSGQQKDSNNHQYTNLKPNQEDNEANENATEIIVDETVFPSRNTEEEGRGVEMQSIVVNRDSLKDKDEIESSTEITKTESLLSNNNVLTQSPPTNFIGKVKLLYDRLSKSTAGKILTMPPVIALIIALTVGLVPPIRYLFYETKLFVVPDTASFIGGSSIPLILVLLGGNICESMKSTEKVQKRKVFGISLVRYCLLPLIGSLFIYLLTLIHVLPSFKEDPVLAFSLMLQLTTPPAVNLVTVVMVSGCGGEKILSTLLLYAYLLCVLFMSVNVTLLQIFIFDE